MKETLALALCLAAIAPPASAHDSLIIGRWQCGRDYIERIAPDYGRSLLVYQNQTAKNHSTFEEFIIGRPLGAPDSYVPRYDTKRNGKLYDNGKPCVEVKSDNK